MNYLELSTITGMSMNAYVVMHTYYVLAQRAIWRPTNYAVYLCIMQCYLPTIAPDQYIMVI